MVTKTNEVERIVFPVSACKSWSVKITAGKSEYYCDEGFESCLMKDCLRYEGLDRKKKRWIWLKTIKLGKWVLCLRLQNRDKWRRR